MAKLPNDGAVAGADELKRFLSRLPQSAARHLQAVLIANHKEHIREAIRASDFSAEGKRMLKWVIRIHPRPSRHAAEQAAVNRLEDVAAETYSMWKGAGERNAPIDRQSAARRLEKKIGTGYVVPRKRRFLIIPMGDLLTPTGRPRKKKGPGGYLQPIDYAELPDTEVIRTQRGHLFLVQRRQRRRRGRLKQSTTGLRGEKINTPLAAHEGDRIAFIGRLVRRAKQPKGLDFFSAWDRLASSRHARYQRMLQRVLSGRST